ncbi:Cupredoxin [Myxozyma melibiosi]|uniref:Cupredoxin n=1 Tax=Myxozyma melibiosi TaxID=54550 RepID=A0ABR1F345_9ASCO
MKSTTATAIVIAAAASSAAAYTVHNVTVGDAGFTYDPDSITADVGDYVRFTIESGTHGIAQSTYDAPCSPYSDNSDDGSDGIYSGLITYSTIYDVPEYIIKINNTDPIWFYCPEAYHCQSGMTGVINIGTNQSLDTYTSLAETQSSNTQPSVEVGNTTLPDSSSSSSGSSSAVSSITSASASSSSPVSSSKISSSTTLSTSTAASSSSASASSASSSASSASASSTSASSTAASSSATAGAYTTAVSGGMLTAAVAAAVYFLGF